MKTGRPKKALATVARTFKITEELDYKINAFLLAHKLKGTAEDRSHIVRLALESYFDDYSL